MRWEKRREKKFREKIWLGKEEIKENKNKMIRKEMPRSAIPDDWERRNIGRKTKRSQEWGGGKVKLKIICLLIFF